MVGNGWAFGNGVQVLVKRIDLDQDRHMLIEQIYLDTAPHTSVDRRIYSLVASIWHKMVKGIATRVSS